jgi:hypothetical protein
VRTIDYRISFAVLLTGLLLTPGANAKNKKPKAPDAKDEIEVVGHVPLTGGPVKRFLSTQHYSSYYLYAERENGGNVTLIDITKTNEPAVLAEMASGNLTAVAGTAALVGSEPAASTASQAPQSIKIMDFSDAQNPKVAREFTGVTAMSRDDQRGLIFVANGDGIWILQRRFAEDPEVQRSYEDYVIYGPSMYGPRR